jgi:hypothetical protein
LCLMCLSFDFETWIFQLFFYFFRCINYEMMDVYVMNALKLALSLVSS